MLYKRADHHSPKWTVRLKVPNVSGFVVKSCKTTDDFEARRFAESLYYQLEGRAHRGEPIKAPSFRRVFELWSRSQDVAHQEGKRSSFNENIRRVELWALRRLGEYRIDLITENVMADYLDWRVGQSKKPACGTLRNERTAINQLFKFAKRKGFIRELPEIKIKAGKQTARPDIPEAEWYRLVSYMDQYLASAQDRRRYRERFYLCRYILILANTGIRIGEARRLRWRDISETRTLTGESRTVFTVRGKTGEREVVCNVGVEEHLKELAIFRAQELKRPLAAGEFVFCHRSGTAIGSFKSGFYRLLKEAGVLYGSDGKRRVPYSLRHTYATIRISEGVSVFQLAANMGTSVEMIEDFYGKKRVRDPKMATEITKVGNGTFPNRNGASLRLTEGAVILVPGKRA